MKKFFYYLMLMISIISGSFFVYSMYHIGDPGVTGPTTVALGFECIVSCIITILMEDRPRITEAQIRHDNYVVNTGIVLLAVMALGGLVVLIVL